LRKSKNSTVKTYKNFRELSLDDIKKIKKFHSEYKIIKYVDEKARNDALEHNKKLKKDLLIYENQSNEYKEAYCKPIDNYINFKIESISSHKINSFTSLFVSTLQYNGDLYKNNSVVNEAIQEINLQRKKLYQIEASNPYNKFLKLKEIDVPEIIKYKKLFRFNGVSYYVIHDDINIDEINEIIESKEDEIKNKKSKEYELKAKAASNASETRRIAESAKRKYPLQHQLNKLDTCPYCEKILKINKPNLDHIYPVSKGGQSRLENLVWICYECNAKKSDALLSQFIKNNNLNKDKIINNLEWLDKEHP